MFIAAPVGPIGVLCIRRTLAEGRLAGFVAGLGAATADAVYGGIAAFGLTVIANFLVNQQVWLRVIGGIFLCYLGVKTLRAKPAQQAVTMNGSGRRQTYSAAYAATFFLTLTNPLTILAFAAIFAGFGAANTSGGYVAAGLLVAGVFLGSAAWWLILSSGVGVLRAKCQTSGALPWVNRISGIIITGFGILTLVM